MRKISVMAIGLLILATLSTSVWAYGPGGGRGHGRGMGPCADANLESMPGLNLSADQSAKIAALREANLTELKPLQDKKFSKQGELRLLWLKTNPDQEKITAVHKEIRAIRDQIQDKMLSYRFSLMKVLTPEQQALIKSKAGGRCFGPGAGFGPGQGRGNGPGGGQGPGMGMRGGW